MYCYLQIARKLADCGNIEEAIGAIVDHLEEKAPARKQEEFIKWSPESTPVGSTVTWEWKDHKGARSQLEVTGWFHDGLMLSLSTKQNGDKWYGQHSKEQLKNMRIIFVGKQPCAKTQAAR